MKNVSLHYMQGKTYTADVAYDPELVYCLSDQAMCQLVKPLTMREGRNPNTPVVIWVGSIPYVSTRWVLPRMVNPATGQPDISINSKF